MKLNQLNVRLKVGVLRQYSAATFANLAAFAYGVSIGWLSPNLQLLLSPSSPLPTGSITEYQAWWIGSLPCVGGALGTLLGVIVAELLGRRISIAMLGIPQLLSWLFILNATHVDHIFIGRVLLGISGGGIFAVGPIFVAEISEDRIRGTLGSFLSLFCNFGIVVGFIMSYYMGYRTTPILMIVTSIIFVVGMICVAESPLFFLSKHKIEKAKSSLAFYRGVDEKTTVLPESFITELSKYNDVTVSLDAESKRVTMNDFFSKAAFKGIIISVFIIMLPPLSGNIAFMSYTDHIFHEAGSKLSSDVSSIIVALIQLLGSYLSTMLIDKAGRKFLLSLSALGCAACSTIMGIYSFYKSYGYDVTSFNWIPLFSLSGMVFICALGVASIPFVIISEILSQKIKGFVVTWCLLELWIFAFLVTKYFPILVDIIGMHGCVWIFAGICGVGAIYVIIFIPETKGKSFEEIEHLLANNERKIVEQDNQAC